jgi:hypothetical protein
MLDELQGITLPTNDKGKGLKYLCNLPEDAVKKIKALVKNSGCKFT